MQIVELSMSIHTHRQSTFDLFNIAAFNPFFLDGKKNGDFDVKMNKA